MFTHICICSAARPKRHTKSVKIGFSLFLVFMISFVMPLYVQFSEEKASGYFVYQNYINNLANFFIYLVVDEEFRAKLRAMCKR